MSNEHSGPPEGMPPGPPPLPENWIAMSGEEKYHYLAFAWSCTQGKPFMSDEIAQKYARRAKRWLDIIALKEPDRVPVTFMSNGFALENFGNTHGDSFYRHEKVGRGVCQFHEQFDSEYSALIPLMSGRALETLKCKLIKWPGGPAPYGLPESVGFQYVEKEYMRADEYAYLIANPEGYLLRQFLPRIYEGLKGLEMLPQPYHLVEAASAVSFLMPLAAGPVREAIDTLLKAADQTMADVRAYMQADMQIMSRFGAPPPFGGICFAPFDLIGDTMRGTVNIMLDMFRRPDDILAACEALLPISVGMAVEGAYATRNPFVIIPLHKGAEGFMSTEQFVKFYWPTFLKQILAMIEAGLVPVPFVEGGYTERLDIIAESGIPAGRTAWLFDRTDMKTAKEKLGGFACIGGNVPASLFSTGTPEMVEAYCTDLLDVAAEGGGFFLSPGAVIDQAKPENVQAYLNVRHSYT